MIDLDMQKLITSWGKTLEVEKAVYLKLWVANGKKGGFQKPRCCSMYSIFIYIWLIYGVNVGKYSIHGAVGKCGYPNSTLDGLEWKIPFKWMI